MVKTLPAGLSKYFAVVRKSFKEPFISWRAMAFSSCGLILPEFNFQ